MSEVASRLDRGLKAAGHPIVGVTVVDPADRATWRAQFIAGATQVQRDAAAAFIATFNPDDPTAVSSERDALSGAIDANLLIQAVAQLDFEERQKLTVKAGSTLLTAPQCKARAKAIYLSLLP